MDMRISFGRLDITGTLYLQLNCIALALWCLGTVMGLLCFIKRVVSFILLFQTRCLEIEEEREKVDRLQIPNLVYDIWKEN